VSLNLAIFVSGRGSNMEAILKAIKDGQLDAKVQVVISNRPDALALAIARNYGAHAVAIDNKGLTRAEHEKRILQELEFNEIDFIVLAGYMRVLSAEFLSHFKDKRGFCRVINIHPSLLPAFPGTAGYEEAFAAGVRESGITIHLVDEHIDHGPILAQVSFPRMTDDTIDSFKARGLRVEHTLYPKVLQCIAEQGIDSLLEQAVQL
jgi:phosphoribosylglycinamide formyltransferase 1